MKPLIEEFLAEDKANDDVTTKAVLSYLKADPVLHFELLAKEAGIFSGTRWLQSFSEQLKWKEIIDEGKEFEVGATLAEGQGPASAVLSLERTVLNGLQILCGVATLAHKYVNRVKEIAAKKNIPAPAILHTRKILPGLRDFIADALAAAGVGRHRFTLADRILVKDNHLMLLKTPEALRGFIRSLNSDQLSTALFEADTLDQVSLLVEEKVKHIMLDNFTRNQLLKLLPSLPNGLSIEISGGIHFDTLEDFVLPGVHRISVGALTHRAKSLDISLEAQTEK